MRSTELDSVHVVAIMTGSLHTATEPHRRPLTFRKFRSPAGTSTEIYASAAAHAASAADTVVSVIGSGWSCRLRGTPLWTVLRQTIPSRSRGDPDVKIRRAFTVGIALTVTILVGGGAAASADNRFQPPRDSLRALAAPINLRIGTAVVPYDLDHPDYAKIAAEQFSSVTPGNEMKWQVVEPTKGTYDWSGGDRLVAFAQQHRQLVRGHTLLWHNQLPPWLTDGVTSGSISNAQLK